MAKRRRSDSEVRLAPETIQEFERIKGQLKTFYTEVSALSKKSPDGAMNKFKLRFINDALKQATALLGTVYRPFPEFEAFNEDEMPTNSDAGVILSQYLNSMGRFMRDHTHEEEFEHERFWNTKGGETQPVGV